MNDEVAQNADPTIAPDGATPSEQRLRRSLRFTIGMFFLLSNVPIGLTGVALCSYLALRMGDREFWFAVGAAIYGFTWIMLGAGVWLAGPEGIEIARQLQRRLLRRKAKPDTAPPPDPRGP